MSANVTTLNHDDIIAYVDQCMRAMKEAQAANEKAMADFNDAAEGLLAIARMKTDEAGVPDFGEDREIITRIVKAARDFRQSRANAA